MRTLVAGLLGLPGWLALLVVFALPALEASAFIGLVVPGELAVLLGGVLAFQHRISLVAVIVAAVAGAVVGDTVGYAVGRRFGPRLLAGRTGRLIKGTHRERAERFLRERGGVAVFLGRFTAALRALMPGIAGMAGMRYRTFAVWNIAGGAVWATGFVLIGLAAGNSWRVAERAAGRAGVVLAIAVVTVALVVLAARWVARHRAGVRSAAARLAVWGPVARLTTGYEAELALLGRRLRPGQATGLALTGVFVLLSASAWAFGALAGDVITGTEVARIDRPVLVWLAGHREPWLTSVLAVVTDLGAAWILIPLVVVSGLGARLRQGSWRPLMLLAAAYGGAWALSTLIKAVVGRPRPPLSFMAVEASGFAFPSGHATQSAAVYGMLAVLIARAVEGWRGKVTAAAGLLLLVLAVGFSRAYLGVHWTTDVLAGWSLGGLWLLLLVAGSTLRRPGQRSERRRPAGSAHEAAA